MAAALFGEQPYEVRFRSRAPQDTWTWLRASGRRIRPPRGSGARVVGMLTPSGG